LGTVSENLYDIPEEVRKASSVKAAEASHREKNEEGKSVNAVKCGKRGAESLHREKNEDGKSVTAVKAGKAAHREKDEEGKSVNAVKRGKKGGKRGAKTTTRQVWVSLHDGFVSHSGNVAKHNRAVGAETEYRVKLTDVEAKEYEPLFEAFNYTTTTSGDAVRRTARRVPEVVLQLLRYGVRR
jgi:hypothetical protein